MGRVLHQGLRLVGRQRNQKTEFQTHSAYGLCIPESTVDSSRICGAKQAGFELQLCPLVRFLSVPQFPGSVLAGEIRKVEVHTALMMWHQVLDLIKGKTGREGALYLSEEGAVLKMCRAVCWRMRLRNGCRPWEVWDATLERWPIYARVAAAIGYFKASNERIWSASRQGLLDSILSSSHSRGVSGGLQMNRPCLSLRNLWTASSTVRCQLVKDLWRSETQTGSANQKRQIRHMTLRLAQGKPSPGPSILWASIQFSWALFYSA